MISNVALSAASSMIIDATPGAPSSAILPVTFGTVFGLALGSPSSMIIDATLGAPSSVIIGVT